MAETTVRRRFPSSPESVGLARRLVADLLDAAVDDDEERTDLVETVTLLVSETVTNAVLHAGTDIDVSCEVHRRGVRVEVADQSPVVPGIRRYELDAMTGRGLGMVDLIASSWGVRSEPDGKTVWFEVAAPSAAAPPSEPRRPLPSDDAAPATFVVQFRGLPVALVRAALQHGDAALRELALLSVDSEHHAALGSWHAPNLDLTPVLDPIERARRAGVTSLDFDVVLPVSAAAGALERRDLIDRANELALGGVLLTEAMVPELGRCRSWFYDEITGQLDGRPPTPWELSAPMPSTRPLARLDADTLARLGATGLPIVVADDANRIVHLDGDAAALLGWNPDDLVGRRLTTLIPPEHREAHLAGFARYQLTAEPHLIGRTVTVDALRGDGTRVGVAMTLTTSTTSEGRRVFCAELEHPTPTT